MNYNLINLIQLMLLVICVTGIFSCAVYSYRSLKYQVKKNISENILYQWLEVIRKMLPEDYIIYEKYGIWRYSEHLKIKMML